VVHAVNAGLTAATGAPFYDAGNPHDATAPFMETAPTLFNTKKEEKPASTPPVVDVKPDDVKDPSGTDNIPK